MSKANGTSAKEETYLQHVSLKNYKSIKDAEIDFKPGLNIIIGKNSSGKTNFLNALYYNLRANHKALNDSESEITIEQKGKTLTIGTILFPDDTHTKLYRKFSLDIGDQSLETDDYHEIAKKIEETKNVFKSNLVGYGVPLSDLKFFQTPSSIVLCKNGILSREFTEFDDSSSSLVIQYVTSLFLETVVSRGTPISFTASYFNHLISTSDKIFRFFNPVLKSYSQVEEVRVNPDFRIEFNSFNNEIILTNFSFQFKVSSEWVPYDFLSDGSKRQFYLISEIRGLNFIHEKAVPEKENFDVILIEEPELGIHPHQLHLLMQFIKEQSRYKQIIITTHSPQVLDTIGSDELDRIIICEYDGKKGTQLRHLSEKETSKAKSYMEDAFLSDYWRFSDLEPAS